jgi:RNA polymerase sigma-70 factor, ECF subfamily
VPAFSRWDGALAPRVPDRGKNVFVPRQHDLDALIARAQEGDVRAFETLLEDHLAQVRRFARAFAGSPSDADDLAQEALIKVYKSLKLFRYQSAFTTWLYAIVRNSFLDATRSRGFRERSLQDTLEPGHAEHQENGGAALPDEALHREQEKERLWRALRRLPAEFKSALVLFDLEGCSYDEVAAIEAVPVGTVKSRLNRARAQLRKLLGEAEETAASAAPLQTAAPGQGPGTNAAGSPSDPPRRSG